MDEQIKKHFKDFLKKERIIQRFNYNLIKSMRCTLDVFIQGNLLVDLPKGDYIKSAFCWEKTTQGHEFWKVKDTKWREYLSAMQCRGKVTK